MTFLCPEFINMVSILFYNFIEFIIYHILSIIYSLHYILYYTILYTIYSYTIYALYTIQLLFLDTNNIWFVWFHLIRFQMCYLLLFAQELLVIVYEFVNILNTVSMFCCTFSFRYNCSIFIKQCDSFLSCLVKYFKIIYCIFLLFWFMLTLPSCYFT